MIDDMKSIFLVFLLFRANIEGFQIKKSYMYVVYLESAFKMK